MHNMRCFVQIEQASEQCRMMTGGYDQVRVNIASQVRDLFRQVADHEHRLALQTYLFHLLGELIEQFL